MRRIMESNLASPAIVDMIWITIRDFAEAGCEVT